MTKSRERYAKMLSNLFVTIHFAVNPRPTTSIIISGDLPTIYVAKFRCAGYPMPSGKFQVVKVFAMGKIPFLNGRDRRSLANELTQVFESQTGAPSTAITSAHLELDDPMDELPINILRMVPDPTPL